jgi:hypothetical protein
MNDELNSEVARLEVLVADLRARRETSLSGLVSGATAQAREEVARLDAARHRLLDAIEAASRSSAGAHATGWRVHLAAFGVALAVLGAVVGVWSFFT